MGLPFVDTLLDIVKGPLDKLIPDKNEKQAFQHELEMTLLKSGFGQMEINKTEAAHPSIFVAGWRPFIGWVCGLALLYRFMLYELLLWAHAAWFPETPAPPALDGTGELMTLVMSLLGLGGLRTYEKLKGVSREAMKRQ